MPYSASGQDQGQGQGQGQSPYTQPTQRVPPEPPPGGQQQPPTGPSPPGGQYSQTEYMASQAPTQRVSQTPPPPAYEQAGQYGQYTQQPAYSQQGYAPAPPAAQVNVNRRPMWWLWALLALFGLLLCGALVAALPGLPKFLPAQPTPTTQPAVVSGTLTVTATAARQLTSTPIPATAAPTDTPAPASTDTPSPPADTATPIVVPTVTPVPPPTDTPQAAPTDTPVPAPNPEPTGTYSSSALADPPQAKRNNGSVHITGRLLRGDLPVEGAAMRIVVHFEESDMTLDSPPTGPDGISTQALRIPKGLKDTGVDVDVIFSVDGQEVSTATTSFTLR